MYHVLIHQAQQELKRMEEEEEKLKAKLSKAKEIEKEKKRQVYTYNVHVCHVLNSFSQLHALQALRCTVEPPNKGHLGTRTSVLIQRCPLFGG